MNRSSFLCGTAGALVAAGAPALAGAAAFREGTTTTQAALFAALPKPKAGDWTRIILGAGAPYQKQIGTGIETAADGSKRAFFEIQVGSPGGSCNPNSLRKAYLRGTEFGSLLDVYPLVSNIGRSANLVFRYADVTDTAKHDGEDSLLRLVDQKVLYDARPVRIVSVARARIHVASRDVETTHTVAEFAPSQNSAERLRRIELWSTPAFPFGVARYRATIAGLDPYDLHVYAAGTAYASDLRMSLDAIRQVTKDGEYGQIPPGLAS